MVGCVCVRYKMNEIVRGFYFAKIIMKTFLVISVLLGCALHMVYAKPSCCSSEDMAIVQEILLAQWCDQEYYNNI